MTTTTALNAYRSHELMIEMRTSSGDVISLDLKNQQSLSFEQTKSGDSKSSSFSFSSLQSFHFSVEGNGIDEQDRKEIDTLMKFARPHIEKFMKELEQQEQHTPLNKVAAEVGDLLSPLKEKDENTQNFAKNALVKVFDDTIKTLRQHQEIIDESRKLLDKIFGSFDKTFQRLYG